MNDSFDNTETSYADQKAFLIGIYNLEVKKEIAEEHVRELERLADTLGVQTVYKISCPIRKIDAATYIGKGKLEELLQLVQESQANLIILDDEISPAQQRNLEKFFKIPVLDRTEVILEVFSDHAKTKEAKLQVELAKIRYELPRLKRLWTHLSRQRGGGVHMKGEGEKQIEIDKRILRARLEKLQQELKKVIQTRNTQRSARQKSAIPTFAIIGYTNAGKSTLLKALTDADVLVEDKLFATLDTTTRKFILPNHQEILLTDTVGFIRKIPYTLVKAFRSTLEEAVEADILLHVVDASHPMVEEQIQSTFDVLKELKADHKPIITLFNKADLCSNKARLQFLERKYSKSVLISAAYREGFDLLTEAMIEELQKTRKKAILKVSQANYGALHDIEAHGHILERSYEDNEVILTVEGPSQIIDRLKQYWIEPKK